MIGVFAKFGNVRFVKGESIFSFYLVQLGLEASQACDA